ncbi:hypothetical protein [Natronorubrum daqingense]|uniref:Uncharacterized protein n=1 Tax=Natronorubrum daqingense TaxID=588898 RepID=A0A1N7E8I0_9EURY|nr:hypothetical protein [Natronorubrum daqingense]APX96423.1 hypothetical protein BB347_07225 [Natronorubrum daqingense]SIR84442.1 hypothetical protein SAMN05421809_2534 [Natronorubrum daqingense]
MSDDSSLEEAGDVAFETLLENGTESLERVTETLEGVDDLDSLEDSTLESLLGDVEKITTVVSEVETMLETLDVSDLPEAVDAHDLLDAIQGEAIPEAIADEETGATDVVDLSQVLSAIDLLNTWDAADLGKVWEQKRAVDDAVEDLADDADDDGLAAKAAKTVSDDDESLLGDDDDGDDDDGLLETDLDGEEAMELLGDIDIEDDPEAYQVAIQQQAMRGIEAFREALLETHEEFEHIVEENRKKTSQEGSRTNSRNPTAVSTMQLGSRDTGGGTLHSTVPKQVKGSTASGFKRIYGRRFEIERERKRSQHD